MKVVIAIDSFKGSLSSIKANEAASEGVKEGCPQAETVLFPIADGGEGTVDALVCSLNGERIETVVSNPLDKKIKCEYGIIGGKTAVIEIAAAAGLPLLNESERNPMFTTTYGVGEMIADAIKRGCREFIIGLGGSATNDCGIGMLSALGFQFLDKFSNPVSLNGNGLKDICEIKTENALKELSQCNFKVACDVKNPLCGENGCSLIFGKQKGGAHEDLVLMDKWMERYAETVKKILPKSDKTAKGAGAAGGLGFAFISFLGGKLVSGIDTILEMIKIENEIKDADVIITGEGKLDSQSAMGKAPLGIASLSKKYNKPVIAFSGSCQEATSVLHTLGIDAFFSIIKSPCSLSDAMDEKNAYQNLKDSVEQVFRIISLK